MKNFLFILLMLPLALLAQQKELYPKVVLINSKLDCSGTMTDSAVRATLGQPDSIVPSTAQCGTFFDYQDSMAYYKLAVLEKGKDSYGLNFIEFASAGRLFVQFGGVKLTAATTIEDITSAYEVWGNLETNEINDQRSGHQVRILGLYMSPADAASRNNTERWNLIFYHGRLIRFELWLAC